MFVGKHDENAAPPVSSNMTNSLEKEGSWMSD
jgi:hypothetical protein